ncbi:AAA domain-containing protein [Mycena kentingensis (nom. inval.)]|nr:AAA domain-containing protein [Mycena kentingensis (nom. inval.)]
MLPMEPAPTSQFSVLAVSVNLLSPSLRCTTSVSYNISGAGDTLFLAKQETSLVLWEAISAFRSPRGRRNSVDVVLSKLEKGGECVLVLDNLETSWEPMESRDEVEDLLSRISGLANLHLIVTLRGEERPGKVQWTRPFLRPLQPLSDAAARQTFFDITDIPNPESAQVSALLELTDNLPLAITLLASLASLEGVPSVLQRWESEHISLLTEGTDKSSNLRASIELSLSSPRLRAIPEALLLLRILAVLPDGATENTFSSMGLPLGMAHISLCRVTLCRTSLAYTDQTSGRIKLLVPIREHIRSAYPINAPLLRPLENFFYSQVEIFCRHWAKAGDCSSPELIKRVSSDLGNIYASVSTERLPLSRESIRCVLNLAKFTKTTYLGSWTLLRAIEARVVDGWEKTDPTLVGEYFAALAQVYYDDASVLAEDCLCRAVEYFKAADDPARQAHAHLDFAYYRLMIHRDTRSALKECHLALSLAQRSKCDATIARALHTLSGMYHNLGDLPRAWSHTLSALAHAQAAGDLDLEFRCLLNRASHFITAGNYPRAVDMCDAMQAIARGLGTEDGRQGLLMRSMRAEVYLRKTEWVQARRDNEAIVEMLRAREGNLKDGVQANAAYPLLNILECDLGMGVPIELAQIDALRGLSHTTHSQQVCDRIEADVRQARFGHLGRAREIYCALLKEVLGTDAEVTNHCFQKLGENAVLRKSIGEAARFYVLHLVLSLRMPDFLNTRQALRRLGDLFLLRGDPETARSLFTVALDGFTLMGVRQAKEECAARLQSITPTY